MGLSTVEIILIPLRFLTCGNSHLLGSQKLYYKDEALSVNHLFYSILYKKKKLKVFIGLVLTFWKRTSETKMYLLNTNFIQRVQ